MLNGKKVKTEDLEQPAIPCGLIAKSFFNDTFKLYKCFGDDCSTNIDKRTEIKIKNNDIAWSSDLIDKFNNIIVPPKNKAGNPQ